MLSFRDFFIGRLGRPPCTDDPFLVAMMDYFDLLSSQINQLTQLEFAEWRVLVARTLAQSQQAATEEELSRLYKKGHDPISAASAIREARREPK